MPEFIPWNSMPREESAKKYARGEFIDIDGHPTHYIVKGKGEPVILIHGYTYDINSWNSNIETLAENFRVYAPDLWGFGYSTRELLDYGYPLYMEQLLGFMNSMNIKKASLVAHSMGGGLSIYFTLRNRERVNKIILVDSAGIPEPLPLVGRILKLPGVGEFLLNMKNNFYRKMVWSSAFFHDKNLLTDEYLESVTRHHKIKGSTDIMMKILRKDFFDTLVDDISELGKMDVPILIAWGRHDTAICFKTVNEMHSTLNGSSLKIFENSGHCPHEEEPVKFNRAAVDFLSSK